MRILLVNPGWDGLVSHTGKRYNKAWPPLDLLYIAALLENKGITVILIDGRARPETLHSLAEEARKADKVFLTTSPMDRWECPNLDLDSLKVWTDRVPPEKLHLLGAHGTMSPQVVRDLIPCYVIVRGEPEMTVLNLCQTEDLSSVLGIDYLSPKGWVRTADRPATDLTQLPTPAYHHLDLLNYHFEVMGGSFVTFEATRGCPYQCSFCSLAMQGRRYRRKPVGQVIRDIEEAVRQLNAKNAFFQDLEFTVDRNYTIELCKALAEKRLPLRWSCQTRLDTIDEEMLKAMKAAGCTLILFGIESGSQRILELTNKHLTLDQIRKGIELTKRVGIEQLGMFMVGFPDETDEEAKLTLELAKELNPTYASFHVATPYPTTKLYEGLSAGDPTLRWGESGGRLTENFGGPTELPRLRALEARAYREFYLRPGYLLSRLLQGSPSSWRRQWNLFRAYAG